MNVRDAVHQHQRILPAHPEQNGAHERMRKTLRGEASRSNLAIQQHALNAFRRLYNDERPHEALQDRPQAAFYQSSPRAYSGAVPPVEYPGHFIGKRVTNAGTVRLKSGCCSWPTRSNSTWLVSRRSHDGIWSIHFCHELPGRVDERDYIIRT